jgi:hypothetical protein
MGIENWNESDPVAETAPAPGPVERRGRMLGGFQAGKGFAPSEVDENDETLTAPIDFHLPVADEGDDTIDAAPFA